MHKRILIVHGWMHSTTRYERLKYDIERVYEHEVVLYELHGFGTSTCTLIGSSSVLNFYVDELRKYLCYNKFDMLIGHSMGARIILQAVLQNASSEHLVLIAPAYLGVKRLRCIQSVKPLIKPLFNILRHKSFITTFLIKISALFTINRYSKIDAQIIQDFRRCDIDTAVDSLLEMTCDDWQLEDKMLNKGLIIASGSDRLIQLSNMYKLKEKLPNMLFVQLNGIGHTVLLEDYRRLLRILSFVL